jgi:hypothetical protein
VRLLLIALTLTLSGCASTQRVGDDTRDVANTIPTAIGTVAAAAVFGGTVSVVPDPESYLKDSVNREGRLVYGDAQRSLKEAVADLFRP